MCLRFPGRPTAVVQLGRVLTEYLYETWFLDLHERGVKFYLSPIVIAEIYVGAFKKEHLEIEALFNLCTRWILDAKTAKQAG